MSCSKTLDNKMSNKKNCVICDGEGKVSKLFLNGLPLLQCEKCRLVWRESFDIESGHYRDLEWDMSLEKLESRKRNVVHRIDTIKNFVSLDYFCDIGCGEGILLKELKMRGFKHIVGIEPNQNLAGFISHEGLTVYRGDISDAPAIIFARAIKTVSLFHVIEHLDDPLQNLQALFRALPSGGSLVIETPDFLSYSLVHSGYENQLIYPEHLFYFNRDNLIKIIKLAGFVPIATGKRDFDQYNFSLRELFFRLGILGARHKNSKIAVRERERVFTDTSLKRKNYLAKFIKRILIIAVIKMGRLDFIWLVAKKP